jgi:hypothetical protein
MPGICVLCLFLGVPQVDILLRNLPHEVHVVQQFLQIGGAPHAGVAVGHIQPTRVTRIPVCILLHLV